MQNTDENVSDIWQFYCASRMRINIHAANRWSDSEQSRVRARALPVGENGFRVDNNELCWLRYLFIGSFSRTDVIESMSFYDGCFRWKFRPKKRLPSHFSASKFNWPDGPATMWFNWPDPKIYWPGPTDPRLRKALTLAIHMTVVLIRILIHTTVVPIRILIRTTVVPIRIPIRMTGFVYALGKVHNYGYRLHWKMITFHTHWANIMYFVLNFFYFVLKISHGSSSVK